MSDAPLLFMLYLILQFSLLAVLRRQNGQRHFDCREIISVRQCPDELDFEILSSKQTYSPTKSGLRVITAPQPLLRLYDKQPGAHPYQRFATINRLLSVAACPPLSSKRLKEELLNILKAQYRGGSMPDYVNGDYRINAGLIGALALPLAVSAYLDYTGDTDILYGKVCCSKYTFKPLSKITPSSVCQSVYTHTINAIRSFKLNRHGILDISPQGFAVCPLCDNVISSLIYCYGVENFTSYAFDKKTRLMLAGQVARIRKNAAKACAENYEECSAAHKMLRAAAGETRGEILEDFDGIPAATVLLYAASVAKSGGDAPVLRALENRDISLTESLLLKNILVKDVMGICYKNGVLKVKPSLHKYKAAVFSDFSSIIIENGNGGVSASASVGGITFNNVDYVKLKGYNKNITITV